MIFGGEDKKMEAIVTASDCPTLIKKRCTVRNPNYEKLDQACHVWFLQQWSRGGPVSGPVIRENVLQLFVMLYPDMYEESFKASLGWLQKNYLRHGIRAMSLEGESLSADVSCISDFQSELLTKIEREGYTLNQVLCRRDWLG